MTMTETQATNEALLLVTRKLRRLHPEAYADIMGRIPEGARWALQMAENAADRHRNANGGAAGLVYPMPEDIEEDEDGEE